MCRKKTLFSLLTGAVMASAGGARAETVESICIASGGALHAAFDAVNAAIADGTAKDRYRLQLVEGTYLLTGLPALGSDAKSAPSIELLGGYAAQCASHTVKPQLTVVKLEAPGAGLPLLDIHAGGDVLIEGIQLGPSGATQAGSDLIHIRQGTGALRRTYWTVSRSLLHGKAAANDAAPPIAAISATVGAENTPPVTVRVENTVVKGFGSPECALQYSEFSPFVPLPGNELILVNDTIAFNETCGVRAAQLDDDSRVMLHNDIIGMNVGDGLITTGDTGSEVELHNNILPTVDAVVSKIVVDRNTLNVNPQLTSYDVPVPGSMSPAKNSGTTYVPGGLTSRDVDDAPRWRGSRPDRGAFETPFDDLTTYTVTNASGANDLGSLRHTVQQALADPGPAKIVFDIKDAQGVPLCPAVIELDSTIVLGSDLIIDGFSQPGSSPNSQSTGSNAVYCIHLSGKGNNVVGLTSGGAPTILAISGIGFVGFGPMIGGTSSGLSSHSEENVLAGNYFGAGLGNSTAGTPGNSQAISLSSANFVTVGGREPAARNYFVDNVTSIVVTNSSAQIVNNYIGSNSAGDALAKSGTITDDVFVEDMGSVFSMQGNLVLGHLTVSQQTLSAAKKGRRIRRNVFGAAATCLEDPLADCLDGSFEPLPGNGIFVKNAGATGAVRGLTIEENVISRGVGVGGANGLGKPPHQVSISRNGFRGRTALLQVTASTATGSDYGFDNDVDPARALDSNRGQNWPVLATAIGSQFSGVVSGTLPTRSGAYVIEVYAAEKCFFDFPSFEQGDSHRLIGVGSTTVVDNGVTNGVGAFQIPVRSDISLAGQYLSATATDADGNSSEFSIPPGTSACVQYQALADAIFHDGFED
jgi:hypothetical protein